MQLQNLLHIDVKKLVSLTTQFVEKYTRSISNSTEQNPNLRKVFLYKALFCRIEYGILDRERKTVVVNGQPPCLCSCSRQQQLFVVDIVVVFVVVVVVVVVFCSCCGFCNFCSYCCCCSHCGCHWCRCCCRCGCHCC